MQIAGVLTHPGTQLLDKQPVDQTSGCCPHFVQRLFVLFLLLELVIEG